MEGYLDKWTNGLNGWQARFVIVDPATSTIKYYTSKKYSNKPCRGQMSLIGAVLDVDDNQLLKFSITDRRNTVFRFQAPSNKDRDNWVQVLETTIASKASDSTSTSRSNGSVQNGRMLNSINENNQSITSKSIDDNDSEFKSIDSNESSLLVNKIEDMKITTALSQTQDKYDKEIDLNAFLDKDINGTSSSIISHLLSQVKIGMDLSSITLPTYVLEPRSLLEMYSDFFSHPFLITEVPKYTNPMDRFIAILRMYLASFHSGKRGSIAKKPYNPILGEFFQCFYNMEKDSNDPVDKESPVPWASKSDLTFISEQVSHHPPISAFYVESIKDRVCFSGHIHTRSKFLGVSIAVHNVGYATTYLIDHNEEYIITFPSGYARSILSVPWLELVGDCELRCPQTKISASIKFAAKPFYGGKKNCVSVNIYVNDSKKPVETITGLWNDKFYYERPNNKPSDELFLDVNSLVKYRRYVINQQSQQSNESRRIWCNVTKSLLSDEINLATKYKSEIENYQRSLAKKRKESNQKFVPKFFNKTASGWLYKHPLYQRLDSKYEWNRFLTF